MSIGPVTRAANAYASNAPAVRQAPRPSFADALQEGDRTRDSFSQRLDAAVESVNASQVTADQLLAELGSAENVDIHGTMIAMEKAEISLRTMVSVRDKAIAAYEQVMNMAI
ncbi:MAG: flagellar hook-basal body complex protein FliE [Deltaproteobacteria bacterium]|nr:flagellar hook-basal body complex protein FliE [Deltaproteobacteria bacterium]